MFICTYHIYRGATLNTVQVATYDFWMTLQVQKWQNHHEANAQTEIKCEEFPIFEKSYLQGSSSQYGSRRNVRFSDEFGSPRVAKPPRS